MSIIILYKKSANKIVIIISASMTFVTRRHDSISMTRAEGRESSLFHASEMASNFISMVIMTPMQYYHSRVRKDGTRVDYVFCGGVEGGSLALVMLSVVGWSDIL